MILFIQGKCSSSEVISVHSAPDDRRTVGLGHKSLALLRCAKTPKGSHYLYHKEKAVSHYFRFSFGEVIFSFFRTGSTAKEPNPTLEKHRVNRRCLLASSSIRTTATSSLHFTGVELILAVTLSQPSWQAIRMPQDSRHLLLGLCEMASP